jgi:hypothetical protein
MKLPSAAFFLSCLPVFGGFAIETSGDSLRVMDDGKLVTEYRTDHRVPYLYPLLTPGGANLTRHWPMSEAFKEEDRDHPHHRSFWMAHGAVNGYDFWAFHDGKDAKIEHKGITKHGVTEDGVASFAVDLAWTAGGKTHLTEKRSHTLRRAGADSLVVTVECALTAADGDVLFGDTKEGMFALRTDRTLRLKGPQAKAQAVNSEGDKGLDTWGKRAKWVAYHGPDETGKPVVAVMFDHPSNLRHPTWWHARDYGLVAANPFGIHDFERKKDKTLGNHTLKKGETLMFRYQLLIHQGELATAGIDDHWKTFSQP